MPSKENNITVVVPVYNVESYLRRCVDSLLKQTIRPKEIILVDDGSPDSSPAICDDYAAKHDYVRVIHKPNGGLSSARRAGWEAAHGELICFVDSDDYVAPTYLEQLATPFSDPDVQLSMCAWANDNCGHITKATLSQSIIANIDIPEQYILPILGTLERSGSINFPGFVPTRMYVTSLLNASDFVSEREYFTEDIILNILYASRLTGDITVVNEPLYYYFINPGSLTLRYRENAFDKLLTCNRLCRQLTEPLDVNHQQRMERLDANMVSAITYGIFNIGRIRNYRQFRAQLNHILSAPETQQVFANNHWPRTATWHKIIYMAYMTKAYFILYKLLKLRKTI